LGKLATRHEAFVCPISMELMRDPVDILKR